MSKILNLPSEPSHIINYIDTDTFQFFIYWLRDKLIIDEKCEGYEDREIMNILLQAVFEPHKYNKEFQKYLKYREEEL